jgi:hypothetical protein
MGGGTCYPKCTFAPDATKPVGCVGKDACAAAFVVSDNMVGSYLGFCVAGCQSNADCAALGPTAVCQIDLGQCATKLVTRSKALGAPCTNADSMNGACNCNSNPSTAQGYGYCSSSCVVGGAPCPNGWICDNGQSTMVTLGAVVVTPTLETPGTLGLCSPPCGNSDAGTPGAEAGSPSDASAGAVDSGPVACPINSTCQSVTPVGPDCTP